eukprot:TRINITY_DN110078_c0_g1_i1.p1 TRINITY_DN110078_c0_g1~~TRINITY_DN110078_c0_g1_i1.p1  ORF type:complete len:416 (+),score=98.11 TRINITY_DN110078_c0_g1_i1:32-1279(+)
MAAVASEMFDTEVLCRRDVGHSCSLRAGRSFRRHSALQYALLISALSACSLPCFTPHLRSSRSLRAPSERRSSRVGRFAGDEDLTQNEDLTQISQLPSKGETSTAKKEDLTHSAHESAAASTGAESEDSKDSKASDLHGMLSIQAVGSGRGSFLLNMGGVKLLINPNLEGSDIRPEKVHELVDYVLITTDDENFLHLPTLTQMNTLKVSFVASAKAGEILTRMMVRNLAILQPGPGGRCFLEGEAKGAAALGLLTAPGAGGGLPWSNLEQAFLFINLENGVALGYEATGQFLGPGASSDKQGIPEEAYMIDYLVTPDLREAAETAKGLTQRGTVLRAVVRLPGESFPRSAAADGSNPLITLDRAIDGWMGGIVDDPVAFRGFLEKQGSPLSEVSLVTPEANGEAIDLAQFMKSEQ